MERREYVKLAPYTTFGIGGAARYFYEPTSEEEVIRALEEIRDLGVPYFVLGNGSNLLISDEGYDGAILHLDRPFGRIRREGNRVHAQSGALLAQVARFAAREGLSGLEPMSGIPGSVGGAVTMNAGAYGGETKDVIERVRVLTKDGVREYTNAEMRFSYRHSLITDEGGIVLEATYLLEPDEPEAIFARIEDFAARRNAKQPVEMKSAGSTFKRPEGHFAAKLIEDAGLKGFRYRNAGVSAKHAGFVVNYGDATAEEVLATIKMVQKIVYERFGVRLEPEMKTLGDIHV